MMKQDKQSKDMESKEKMELIPTNGLSDKSQLSAYLLHSSAYTHMK